MERTVSKGFAKTKLSQHKVGREMKRVAKTGKPPVVVPVVVVAVDVHIALVIPPVERGELYKVSSSSPPFKFLHF
jgi:hypothetical protein